jgi:hypothetical protein
MPEQPLDDRIKELCAKAVATPPSPELEEILSQLQTALREHGQQMRKMAASFRARMKREAKKE